MTICEIPKYRAYNNTCTTFLFILFRALKTTLWRAREIMLSWRGPKKTWAFNCKSKWHYYVFYLSDYCISFHFLWVWACTNCNLPSGLPFAIHSSCIDHWCISLQRVAKGGKNVQLEREHDGANQTAGEGPGYPRASLWWNWKVSHWSDANGV